MDSKWIIIAATGLVIVAVLVSAKSSNAYRTVYNRTPMTGSGETYRTVYDTRPAAGSAETYGREDRSIYSPKRMNSQLKPMPYRAVFTNKHFAPADKQPVPGDGIETPSFPITSSFQPSDAKQPSFFVKFLTANGQIDKRCLKGYMANQIPHENVMPSSLDIDGNFKHICPGQESADLKMWPF